MLTKSLNFPQIKKVHKKGTDMIRTITIGSYISVQGVFERQTEGGDIVIRVGEKTYQGKPVSK